jgi:N-acetyl-anhydromuramyl-L-alanine amidase AmpD
VCSSDLSRIKYAEPEQVTFHAGKSKFLNREEVNDFSIGVEFQGDTNKKPLTEDQINSAIEYLIPIIKKNNIPIENITTHAIIAGERKQDINDKEYKRFLMALRNKYYSK